MDKSRKFDFETDVRVPEMDEIMKVAADFSDTEAAKTSVNIKEALSQNAKIAPKMGSEMSAMRQKMRKLAREIAEEESKDSGASSEIIESVTADEAKSEIEDTNEMSKTNEILKQEKVLPKKTTKEKAPETNKKSGDSNKKK